MPKKGQKLKTKTLDEMISARFPIGTRKAMEEKDINVSEFMRKSIFKELRKDEI